MRARSASGRRRALARSRCPGGRGRASRRSSRSAAWTTAKVSVVMAEQTRTSRRRRRGVAPARGATAGTRLGDADERNRAEHEVDPERQRQLAASATTAPRSGPMRQATANVVAVEPNATILAGPRTVALIVASAAVITTPPPTPWTTRAISITAALGAAAAGTLPTGTPPARRDRHGVPDPVGDVAGGDHDRRAGEREQRDDVLQGRERGRDRRHLGQDRGSRSTCRSRISATPSESARSPIASRREKDSGASEVCMRAPDGSE